MLGDECLDVFLGDAAAQSCAGNFGEIDVVVLGDLAHERAGADASLLAIVGLGIRLRLGRLGGWWRRSSFLLGFGSRSGRRSGLGWRGGGGSIAVSDDADYGVDLDGVAGLDLDLLERAGRGSRNFGVNLVGGDFEQGLVALHLVAGLLEPLGDGSFEDRFPHLGHDYVCWHGFLPWGCGLEIAVKRK